MSNEKVIMTVAIPEPSSHFSVEPFPPRFPVRQRPRHRKIDKYSLRVDLLKARYEGAIEISAVYIGVTSWSMKKPQKHALENNNDDQVMPKKPKLDEMKPLALDEVMTREELEQLGLSLDDSIFEKF